MAETIFALSSGRPPAAISVIRLSGDASHSAARQIAGSLPVARKAALRRLCDPVSGDRLDDALVIRFDAPASSTGENAVEFHCHGGRAVVDAVLAALAGIPGLREARPGEFTRRAFDNGRIDLTEAEGLADLVEAETESQRKAALALAEGGLRKQIEQWREQLLACSAIAERGIDYDEEDESLDSGLLAHCAALQAELEQWLSQPRAEPLKDGVLVVVAGPPNSGKSSLINVIVGEDRAIVSELAGTTRDHIEVPMALGGVPLRLTDTAGLRKADDPIERIGVERAQRLVELADVLVWLGDARDVPDHPRRIVVRGKADLLATPFDEDHRIAVSSFTGQGLPLLLRAIEESARKVLPAENAIVLNRRQANHVAEAAQALSRASGATDLILLAEELRTARMAFDRLTGRAGFEDLLDALFNRFCLGK